MRLQANTLVPRQFFNPMNDSRLWGDPAHFYWKIGWETDATSGYIVQEIYVVIEVTNCRGVPQPPQWSRYFEAWRVTGRNSFDPNPYDIWTIQLGLGTRGVWTKTGVAHCVATLDPNAGFRPGGAREANQLLSTYTQPANLGPALVSRTVQAEWNGCGSSVFECFHSERMVANVSSVAALGRARR